MEKKAGPENGQNLTKDTSAALPNDSIFPRAASDDAGVEPSIEQSFFTVQIAAKILRSMNRLKSSGVNGIFPIIFFPSFWAPH